MVLGLRRQEPPGTKGTREYPRALYMPTRPRSADASVGLVKLAPSDVANPTGITSRLLAMADAPASTWPESPAAQSKSPDGHPPSGQTLNRLSCMQVSDPPTRIPASPKYRNQRTSDSRTSCKQPHLLSPQVVTLIIHQSWIGLQVQGRPLCRVGIARQSREFEARAPQGLSSRVQPHVPVNSWEAGFTPEARKRGPQLDKSERPNSISQ